MKILLKNRVLYGKSDRKIAEKQENLSKKVWIVGRSPIIKVRPDPKESFGGSSGLLIWFLIGRLRPGAFLFPLSFRFSNDGPRRFWGEVM